MKKLLVLTMAMIIVTTFGMAFVSCSDKAGNNESSAQPEPSSEAPASSAEPSQEPSEEPSAEPSEVPSEEPSAEPSEEPSTPVVPVIGVDDGKFTFTVFGDSIAYGYLLDNPQTMCYGALFASDYEGIIYNNYAVSGHTTGDFLTVLNRTDVSSSDLIEISIGANNLLGPAIGALQTVMNKYGANIINDYISAIMGNGDTAKAVEFIKALEEAFTGEDFRAKAAAGLAKLNDDIPAAIEKIRARNDKCVIVIQTIYNPYKGFALGIPGEYSFDFSAACEAYLAEYNAAIRKICEDYSLNVLEVHSDFDTSATDLINAGLTLLPTPSFNYDPHPNAEGHRHIAKLLSDMWKSLTDEAHE